MCPWNSQYAHNMFHPNYQFERIGTSISRWCSDGSYTMPNQCGCHPECIEPDFVFASQENPFSIMATQAIPFTGPCVTRGNFAHCNGQASHNCCGCSRCNGCSGRCNACSALIPCNLPFIDAYQSQPCMCYYEELIQCDQKFIDKNPDPCATPCGVLPPRECTIGRECSEPIIDVAPNACTCPCGCASGQQTCPNCYFENGVITVNMPGMYRIEYTINVPENADVQTEVHLMAGGSILPGSTRIISHSIGSEAITVSAEVLYDAQMPTEISLVSTNAMSLSPTMLGQQLATIMIASL